MEEQLQQAENKLPSELSSVQVSKGMVKGWPDPQLRYQNFTSAAKHVFNDATFIWWKGLCPFKCNHFREGSDSKFPVVRFFFVLFCFVFFFFAKPEQISSLRTDCLAGLRTFQILELMSSLLCLLEHSCI